MTRGKRAILHIGTEKTGSSTLQIFLARNRAQLNANGFHYPEFAGHTNHVRLAAFAQGDDERDDLRIDLGIDGPAELAAFRERMRAEAAAEVAAHADKTFVFSNEHCSSRLVGPPAIARLQGLLAPLFEEIRIAVYLRRQDRVAVSLYSTLLKFGGDREAILPDPAVEPNRWDYNHLLGNWGRAFGREAVVARIFDRAELRGGCVLADFIAEWDLGSGYEIVKDANESLQPHAAEVLRRLNTRYPGYIGLELNRMRGELGERIATLFPGRGLRPARADAEAFYRNFTAQNEACRAEWFPERARLFDDDFSGYPEAADGRSFGFDDAIEVMGGLWGVTQATEIGLRYDRAIRDGQIAERRGDIGAALAAYDRAMWIDPDRPLARDLRDGAEKTARIAEEEARRAEEDGRRAAEAEALRRSRDEVAAATAAAVAAEDAARRAQAARAQAAHTAAALARLAALEARETNRARRRKRFTLNRLRRLLGLGPAARR